MISNHLVDHDIMDEEFRVSPSIAVFNMQHVLYACKTLVRSAIFPSAALGRTLWRQCARGTHSEQSSVHSEGIMHGQKLRAHPIHDYIVEVLTRSL